MSAEEKQAIEVTNLESTTHEDEGWGSFLDDHKIELYRDPPRKLPEIHKNSIVLDRAGNRVTNPEVLELRKHQQGRYGNGAIIERNEYGKAVGLRSRSDNSGAAIAGEAIERDPGSFISFLEHQPDDSKWAKFVELLGDKPNLTLAKKMQLAGITLPELTAMYHDAQKTRALWNAIERLPDILFQQSQHALDKLVLCERCDGTGQVIRKTKLKPGEDQPADVDPSNTKRKGKKQPGDIEIVEQCRKCNGTGKATEAGQKDAINRILEVTGMVQKKGNQTMNINIHQAPEDSVSEVGKIMEEVGNIFDVNPE